MVGGDIGGRVSDSEGAVQPRFALLHGAMAAVEHMETAGKAAAGVVAAGDEEVASMSVEGDGLFIVRVVIAVARAAAQKVCAKNEYHVKAAPYAASESARGVDLDLPGEALGKVFAISSREGDDSHLHGGASLFKAQCVYPPGVGDKTIQELIVKVRACLVVVKTHIVTMLTVALQCGEYAALKVVEPQ